MHAIITQAQQQRRTLLTETESKQILQDLGIATTPGRLATTADEAVQAAEAIGFPVVLKISSRDIVHKSDVGGVRLHLHNAADVCQAFQAIQESVKAQAPQAHVDGVAVQAMAPPGLEVIIGMTKDATFGPVLMFGLGGVLVELIQDVAFRIVPLTPRDAVDMIRDIQGFPLLTGYRGTAPADLAALQNILLTLSAFVEHTPVIKAMDLNPVYAYAAGAVAVDARIVLEEEPADLGVS